MNEFYKSNRKNIINSMGDNSVLIQFSGKAPKKSADGLYPYTPNRNFYYMTGIDEENIIFVIIKTYDKSEEFLFIPKRDELLAKWVGETITENEAKDKSGIENILNTEDFNPKINEIIKSKNITSLFLDLERESFESSLSYEEIFAKNLKEKYPEINIKNIHDSISNLRVIKDEKEVSIIEEAISITDKAILNLIKNAKPDMMEYEMEAYFNFTLKSNGIKDFAFDTICASGINGTVLHYVANDSKAKDGDLVLLDLGAMHKYYSADISRTFPVNGKFSERQKDVYNLVLKAQLAVIEMLKPGVTFPEINNLVHKIYAEGLKDLGVIENDNEVSKYYFHNTSHYLGLDTHDVGSRDIALEKGMIITVEPGLYIPEEAIGIRIEDNILITEDGCRNLSKNIIKTVDEIENFMKK